MEKNIDVAIIMGSDSDLPIMSDAAKFLDTMGISYEMKILSVHRCPDEAIDYAKGLKERNVKAIICRSWWSCSLTWNICSCKYMSSNRCSNSF